MYTKKVEVKKMVCIFREDGSMGRVYDPVILDEPFMGILYNTLNDLADVWFEFVEDSKEAKEKVKRFEIIIKI